MRNSQSTQIDGTRGTCQQAISLCFLVTLSHTPCDEERGLRSGIALTYSTIQTLNNASRRRWAPDGGGHRRRTRTRFGTHLVTQCVTSLGKLLRAPRSALPFEPWLADVFRHRPFTASNEPSASDRRRSGRRAWSQARQNEVYVSVTNGTSYGVPIFPHVSTR
jgi:hypothetical protein